MDKKIKPLKFERFFSVKNPVSKIEVFSSIISKNRHHDVTCFLDREQTSIDFSTNSRINLFLINHINY